MAQNDQDLDLTSAEDDIVAMNEESPEMASESYRGVGDDLRRERERVGWTIGDVSDKLKIRRAYIVAIENGDSAALPGHSYAVGFVRSYAELMGADGELCVDYYKQETSGQAQPLDLHFPVPSQESRRPGIGALALCVLLAAGAYGVYYYYQSTGRANVALVPDVPDEISGQVSTGVTAPGVPAGVTSWIPGKDGGKPPAGAGVAGAEIQGVASVSIAAMTSTEAHAAVPEDDRNGGVNASLPQVSQVARDSVNAGAATDADARGPVGDGGKPAAITRGEDAAITRGEDAGIAPSVKARVAPVPVQRTDVIAEATATTDQALKAEDDAVAEPLKVASLPPPLPSVEQNDRAPRAFGTADKSRITVRVSKPTRVVVSRVDGRKMLDRRLIAGDSYAVPDQQGLVLQADDASALSLQMDGQKLGLPVSVGKTEFPLEIDWLSRYR